MQRCARRSRLPLAVRPDQWKKQKTRTKRRRRREQLAVEVRVVQCRLVLPKTPRSSVQHFFLACFSLTRSLSLDAWWLRISRAESKTCLDRSNGFRRQKMRRRSASHIAPFGAGNVVVGSPWDLGSLSSSGARSCSGFCRLSSDPS